MESCNLEIFWTEAINQIKTQISNQEFDMWFQNMDYVSCTTEVIKISVPSNFYRDQVKQRYLGLIENTLLELSGNHIILEFLTVQKNKTPPQVKSKPVPSFSSSLPQKKKHHPQLRKDYTFDNFVVGNNNNFAANAAIAISKNPGESYNPCLIYGGVGLGKTHLMQSIGASVFDNFDNFNVVYVTAERFVVEFIQSIREKKGHRFKNKYRSVDVLLIDDIHDLENKSETQEELFHTFNALYDANKQMVFTCDRPVSELKSFTARLRSRFERGLNVDLQPPNFETRCAILNKKFEEKKRPISPKIIEMIAKNITTNIRDLEAALTKLIAYSDLVGKEITETIAKEQLKHLFSGPVTQKISIDLVQKVVSEYFNVSQNDMKGKKRTQVIAFPRQVAMYIIREITDYSTTEVGLEFGGRDHTTVMYACQKIEEKLKSDPTLEPLVNQLIRTTKDYGTNS